MNRLKAYNNEFENMNELNNIINDLMQSINNEI